MSEYGDELASAEAMNASYEAQLYDVRRELQRLHEEVLDVTGTHAPGDVRGYALALAPRIQKLLELCE